MSVDLTHKFCSKVADLPMPMLPKKVQFIQAMAKQVQLNIRLVHTQFKEHIHHSVQTEQKKDQYELELFQSIQGLEDKLAELQKVVDLQFQMETQQTKAHYAIMISELKKRLGKVGLDLQNYKLKRVYHQNRLKKLTDLKPKGKVHRSRQQYQVDHQELQQQNQELIERYTSDHDQIKTNQKKLSEISQLIAKFSQTVGEQDQITEQISSHAKTSLGNVEQANRNLEQASHYSSGFGQVWSYFFLSLAGFLLAYDYIRP